MKKNRGILNNSALNIFLSLPLVFILAIVLSPNETLAQNLRLDRLLPLCLKMSLSNSV
jgi:hypothetical protein